MELACVYVWICFPGLVTMWCCTEWLKATMSDIVVARRHVLASCSPELSSGDSLWHA